MQPNKKSVCVVGLGYIGLPTAALLASEGYEVIGVDANLEVIRSIQAGKAHIAEADLDNLLEKAITSGKLKAKTTCEPADIFIIAVPTPLKADKSPDLTAVEAAFDSIAPHLKQGDLVILESTCPVGTSEFMVERLNSQRPELRNKVHVAYCPERVLPGQILKELVEIDRVVGGITPACTQKAIEFYQSFVQGQCFATDSKTAELCKLTENSFRDVNIAFANELSLICDQQGIDVWQLIKLANRHPRVNILQPGCGVGGHCIAVDPFFIVNQLPETSKLIQAARMVNDTKPLWVTEKIIDAVEKHQEQTGSLTSIACLGITFKANVDDTRESPAILVVEALAKRYTNQLMVVEPNLEYLPKNLVNLSVKKVDYNFACQFADVLVILVDHETFIRNNDVVKKLLKFDNARGVW